MARVAMIAEGFLRDKPVVAPGSMLAAASLLARVFPARRATKVSPWRPCGRNGVPFFQGEALSKPSF